jgi:hypothetical protein
VEFSHDGYERRQGFIQKPFVRAQGDAAAPAQQPSAPAQAGSSSPDAETTPGFAPLTEQQKAEAVRQGLALKGAIAGVVLSDASAPAASASGGPPSAAASLALRLYTPETWIQQQASDAARQQRPFTVGDITAEMLEPVLRVVAYPADATRATARGAADGSVAEHVVLRDDSRRLVVQPLSKTPLTDRSPRDAPGQGLVATFSLADVRELSGPDNDREFLIVVVGYGGRSERTFQIGPKERQALPY